MAPSAPTARPTATGQGQWLHVEASEVLSSLRSRVADVLSALGSFNRPAEVQKALGLDKTLSRQVFKVAGTAEPLGSTSVVPSRTSMGRFLDAAKVRGIPTAALKEVWDAYELFERLVRVHAGDRVTFNTMLSSITPEDEEWALSDSQHRRNAYRAMSHTLGSQMKARVQLFIVTELDGGGAHEVTGVSGLVGLRLLHVQPSVRVDGVALSDQRSAHKVCWEPLGISNLAGGHLLDAYSSQPLQQFKIVEGGDANLSWRTIRIENPEVGNLGTSTLMFGARCPRLPSDGTLNLQCTTYQPTEVLLFDVLIQSDIAAGAKPQPRAVLGLNEKFGTEVIPLRGRFDPDLLGQGPKALATPEVPHYPEMVQTVADKLGRDLNTYNAWRMRVEFPLYQSTVMMKWTVAT